MKAVALILVLLGAFCAFSGNEQLGALANSVIATGVAPNPLNTPRPDDDRNAGQLILQAIVADDAAWASASTAQVARAALTATYLANNARATDQAAYLTQAAEQTAQAATWQAAAAGTQVAGQIIGWTATADMVQATSGAERSASATARADTLLGLTITADVANAAATATIQAVYDGYNLRALERAEQRAAMVNDLMALAPYAVWAVVITLLVGTLVVLVRVLVRVLASRLLDRLPDVNGRYPLIADGYGNIYDVDRNPHPLVTLGRKPVIPVLVNPQLQAGTTERDQMIDLATRGAGQAGKQANAPAGWTAPAAQNVGGVNSRIFLSGEIPGEFSRSPELLSVLEGQWKEDR